MSIIFCCHVVKFLRYFWKSAGTCSGSKRANLFEKYTLKKSLIKLRNTNELTELTLPKPCFCGGLSMPLDANVVFEPSDLRNWFANNLVSDPGSTASFGDLLQFYKLSSKLAGYKPYSRHAFTSQLKTFFAEKPFDCPVLPYKTSFLYFTGVRLVKPGLPWSCSLKHGRELSAQK